jgi:hypothetical protein
MGHKLVCLNCRKAFNIGADYDDAQSNRCPDCGNPATRYPHRFRPPRRTATKQWAVVKFLQLQGFTYQHIHQPGVDYVPYPSTMYEAQSFVLEYKSQARSHPE